MKNQKIFFRTFKKKFTLSGFFAVLFLFLFASNAYAVTTSSFKATLQKSITQPKITTPNPLLNQGGEGKSPIVNVAQSSSLSNASLTALIKSILNQKDLQNQFKGPKGDVGPQGPQGFSGGGGSSYSPTPIASIPMGITIPDPTHNFSGGTYANIANLSSNIFTNTTSNITTANISALNVSGSSSLKDLTVTGTTTLPSLTMTGPVTGTSANFSGNVGVGTTAPITQLHVAGKLPTSASATVSSVATNPTAIAIQGSYAYVVGYGNSSLEVFDISNPLSPQAISTTATDGLINKALAVQGKYAYVMEQSIGGSTGEVQIFDISNPLVPVSVGKYVTGGGIPMYAMSVQGNYVYVARLGNGNSHLVVDVSNPSSPVLTATFPNSGILNTRTSAMDVSGKYAYLVGTSGVLEIYNVSNSVGGAAAITAVGSVTATTGTNMGAVKINGRYAYVISNDANQLQIFDVNNPASPTQVNSTNLAAADNSVLGFKTTAASDISIQGRYAYITSQVSNKLQVFDISNPTSPVAVESVATGTSPLALTIKGRNAYVLNYTDSTMQVFDIGGGYIQQLQTGNVETDSLFAKRNSQFGSDVKINGGLTVGYNALFNSGLAVTASDGNSTSTTLFASPNGRVGIGTDAPTSLLHTVDTAAKTASYTGILHSVTDTSSTASINKIGLDVESTGTWNGTSAVNTGLVVNATGGTTNYAATFSGGNVGIGTTTPSYKLDVNGNVNVAAGSAYNLNGTNVVTASTTLSNYFFGPSGNLTGTGLNNVVLGIDSLSSFTNGSNNVAIGYRSKRSSTGGNYSVAIGYTSLQINSNDSNTAIGSFSLPNATSDANTAVGYESLKNLTSGRFNTALGYDAGYTLSTLNGNTFIGYGADAALSALTNSTAIGYNAVVGASNSLVLGGTGSFAVNVGIGTTSPGFNLEVSGASTIIGASGYSGAPAIIQRAANGTASSPSATLSGDVLGVLGFRGYGTTAFSVASKAVFQAVAAENWTDSAQGTYFSWQTTVAGGTSRTEKLRLSSTGGLSLGNSYAATDPGAGSMILSGNLGIANTNPQQKLDVTGTIRQSNCTTAGTISVNASGDIICTPSSQRFKDNITDLSLSGLSTITSLRPVSYTFKPEMNMGSATHYGFISEEVNSIDPALATHDTTGLPYGLDTNAILAASVSAIKELNLKINDNTKLMTSDEMDTKKLCVADDSGSKTCVTKAQLDAILSGSGSANVVNNTGSTIPAPAPSVPAVSDSSQTSDSSTTTPTPDTSSTTSDTTTQTTVSSSTPPTTPDSTTTAPTQ